MRGRRASHAPSANRRCSDNSRHPRRATRRPSRRSRSRRAACRTETRRRARQRTTCETSKPNEFPRRSRGDVSSPRRLVVDLAATAPSWALPAWGEAAILSAAPADWDVHFVRDLAVSDGDGTGGVSAEALSAAADAEVYFGHGLPPTL